MGSVFLVYDRELRANVALKELPKAHPSALARFKREFRALAGIVHPNLVPLYELIADDNAWYFTMEPIAGVGFSEWIRAADTPSLGALPAADPQALTVASGPQADETIIMAPLDHPVRGDWTRLRKAFGQLAEGIHALHVRGKIHRDIKPSNVMVRDDGQVVILDFGLIAETAPHVAEPVADTGNLSSWHSDSQTSDNQVVGTIRYMSPEQAAAGNITGASDWYSMGVMLYEALVGRAPFAGKILKVLACKQKQPAPTVLSQTADAPQDLAQLCDQLLAIEPLDRPNYQQIAAVFGADQAASHSQPGPVFVGRSSLMARLQSAFALMQSGERVTLVVSGDSGFGKSALIEHFLEQLRSKSVVVARGRCYEQESVPFKTLDSLVDSLARYLRSLPKLTAARLMPRQVGQLARLFPVLSQIEGFESVSNYETVRARDVRQVAFAALVELVARIGDHQPLVLVIDDMQWGDNDSVEALRMLMETKSPARVMLIVSHRAEYGLPPAYASWLQTLRDDPQLNLEELNVGPLATREARQLVQQFVGERQLAPAVLDRILDEAQGSPLFLQQLVQYFLSCDSDVSENSLRLDSVIHSRLALLNPQERQFLEMLAVVGKPTKLQDLLHALPSLQDPQRIITKLHAQYLLSSASLHATDQVQVYHDRVRETVSATLLPELKRDYHLEWADTLLKQEQPDPESLAVHYGGGGRLSEAGHWYAVAAKAAEDALAFEHASHLYEQSLELRPVSGSEELELRLGLARAYANAGRGTYSAEQYLRAAETCEPDQRLDLQALAAGQLCISGNIDEGLSTFANVLEAYRVQLPKQRGAILRDLLWQRTRLAARGLGFRSRSPSETKPEELKRIDNLWGIASGLSSANNIAAAALQTRILRECLCSGDGYRVARSMAWEAFLTSTGGRYKKANVLLSRAQALAEQSGNQHAHGMCLLAKGLIEFQQAKLLQAAASLRLAEEHFREASVGGWWELATIRWIYGTSLLHAGKLNELSTVALHDYRDAQERGDLYALTNMQAFLVPFLELTKGHVATAQEYTSTARSNWDHAGFHYQHLQSVYMECLVCLYCGQARQAYEKLESIWPGLKAALVLHNKFVRVMMLDTRATSTLAAAHAQPKRGDLTRRAQAHARSLCRERDPWSRAFANRIAGGVALLRGDMLAAEKYWRQAIDGFQAFDMKLHAASVRLALARILDDSQAQLLRSQATAEMLDEGVVDADAFGRCLTWTTD